MKQPTEMRLYVSKPEKTNAIDWLRPAEQYVASLTAEHAADRKKFYRHDYGAERARAAIAALESLARKLQPFNVAN